MPALGPIKRRELIEYLRQLGFDGPFVRYFRIWLATMIFWIWLVPS
jgi:hypothetical protein